LCISGQSEGCQEEKISPKGRINKTRIFYLTDPCHQSGRITTTKISDGKGISLQESGHVRKLFNDLPLLYAPLDCQDKNWAMGIENISPKKDAYETRAHWIKKSKILAMKGKTPRRILDEGKKNGFDGKKCPGLF
jgi:hypothetical protein